ncbi:Bug family tripartite tricarboxylate transporter substrate binding protein [Aquabacter spiritensis]|uniref:Tripartite-type tricarboxylate transporter receptor subunit TctC n=1 Tax=Aquabacter spiritensis TaxID=933073 RepID=A0A4R3LTH1_9HYPH|nr:tripartite tricarboxylate transporter substrate binding protein [Aquabacter spiritensis]TCT03850.1 tripartite-type tricarboxylate transporter receptor subunit TctC [Aquabacter spiritensis]
MVRFILALFAAALPFALSGAQAAPYPERPIRVLVPYPPGGTTDVMARAMQDPLSRLLGQPVVVENRAGAAGAIAAREVAKATPDGYTLLFSNDGPSVIAPLLQKQAGYDAMTSFTPISLVATQPMILVVNGDLPVDDLEGFVAYAKRQEKPLLYAHAGTGSSGHLSTELLAQTAGIQLSAVPYKGSSVTTLGVMNGEVQVLLTTSTPTMLDYIRAGKLKLMGMSTTTPDRLPPGTPLISDMFAGFKQENWFGLVGPAGLSPDITQKLNAAIRDVVAQPEVKRIFLAAGFIPMTGSPAELQATIVASSKLWQSVIAERGIAAD